MPLEVTNVRLYPVAEHEELLSYASIVLEEEFVVHNIRLVKTDEKVIVAMPNEEYQEDYRDIAHPITNDCRQHIRRSLIDAFNARTESSYSINTEKPSP